jgi:MFS superfamily sulfate permease-like transporter
MLKGVLIGAILSIILLLRRASRPHVAVLGRVPGTNLYGDIERNPENEPAPEVLVFRVDSSILYFNSEFVREKFLQVLNAQPSQVKLAVWCLGTTPHMDLAGTEMLAQLHEELIDRDITLVPAEARGPVRAELRAAGLEHHFGPIRENATIPAIIQQWQGSKAPSSHKTKVPFQLI